MAKVTKTKIGRVMLLNKGTYNVETAYSELDVVKESGRTYICLKNCKGIQPTNTEYWILAADIGISPTNKEDYNTEEEKLLYANELSDYGKIALDEYTAEKVEQLIAKEVELEGVLDTEKDKQIGIVNDKAGIYNANAETKTLAFTTNASDKTAAFDTNAETKTSAFNTNASEKNSGFNTNASEKTSAFNANAESKTSAFNTNASEKIASFNQNASDKVAEFDDVKNDLLGQADDLFDALTTNEASGNELYIDDAKACRVINSEIDGMYKQETTSGKNLLEVVATSQTINGITFTINEDKTITANGTANGNSILILNSFDFQNGETYILNGCPNNGGINSYKLDAFGQSGLSNDIGNGTDINVGGQRDIRIVIFDGNSVNNLVFKPMIIKGSQATEYEPYTGGNPSPNPDYPQEIKQVESVKLNIKGKNLCDGINQNYYLNNDVNRCGKTTSDSGLVIDVQDKAYVTVSTKIIQERYRIACVNILPQDEENIVVAYRGVKKDNTSATVTANTTGYKYLIINATDLGSILAEDGSVATEYEPYKKQTVAIDLKGNKLCAISDTIKDKLLIDRNGNVALQKNVNFINMKETNYDWKNASETEKGYTAFYTSNLFFILEQNGGLICNYFTYLKYDGNDGFLNKKSNEAISDGGGYKRLYFRLKTGRLETNDIAGFKKFLKDNDIIVYYSLATPELIDLGQLPELPKTFNGINNIWAETNLGNTQIEIEYVQDVKKLLEQTQAIILNNASEEVTEE